MRRFEREGKLDDRFWDEVRILRSSTVGGPVSLALAIGETSKIESADKGKIDDIVQKVRDLKSRLEDIRREQVFQRV